MPGAAEILGAQDANTNSLVQALTTFFSDPSRLTELSSIPNAVADQAYSSTTGQFREAGQSNAFDLARRGLRGSSVEQERVGDLNTQFSQAVSQIEAQRLAATQQNRMNFANQYLAALQSAYAPDPMTQAALQANLAGLGANTQAAQQQGYLAQQNAAMQDFNNNEFSQALGNPLNLYAAILRGQ